MKEGSASRPIRVLLSGGGTGGHLVPGLNLAGHLRAGGDRVHLLRPGRRVEDDFLADPRGIEVHAQRLHGRGVRWLVGLPRSLLAARRLLRREAIDVVVGLGGGGSLPAVLAAWKAGIPVALLEQNVHPGRANRLAARLARCVYTGFPDTVDLLPGRRAIHSGMPLVADLVRRPDPALIHRYGLEGRCVLLVVGGSQGAEALNLGIPALLSRLDADLRGRLAVVHLAGVGKEKAAADAYACTGIAAHVLAFERDMPSLYAIADLVLCRGGATTLVEVAAAGRPAVVVPYPWHRDRQQFVNAEWLATRGACRVLEQDRLAIPSGVSMLEELLRDPAERRAMGERGATVLPRDAGPRIAADLRALAAAPAVFPPRRVEARGGVEKETAG